jgi:polyhydroxyalkanoate synthesis repressor PhaR
MQREDLMSDAPRVVKRYANRKLYDTQESRYVTLEQIAELIRQGEDVKVVDNASKEDLTSVTLAQIIYEEEKRQRSFLPLSALRKVIETGGESLHELVSQLQESAGRVGRVFRREDEQPDGDSSEATAEARADEQASPLPEDAEVIQRTEPTRMIRDFIDGIQQTIDEWQKRLDANVHHAWESVSPLAPLQKEINALQARITDLEKRLTAETTDRPEARP